YAFGRRGGSRATDQEPDQTGTPRDGRRAACFVGVRGCPVVCTPNWLSRMRSRATDRRNRTKTLGRKTRYRRLCYLGRSGEDRSSDFHRGNLQETSGGSWGTRLCWVVGPTLTSWAAFRAPAMAKRLCAS